MAEGCYMVVGCLWLWDIDGCRMYMAVGCQWLWDDVG